MTLAGVFQDEQSVWQRRAAAELAAILRQHRDLPVIAWTIGAAGCVLLGQVTGPPATAARRAVFAAWQAALALEEHKESGPATGTVQLCATAHRNRVRVHLVATILDAEAGPGGGWA